jgi:hypothetical protein
MQQDEQLNLDKMCADAQRRVRQYVNRAAAQHLRQMREEANKAREQKTGGDAQ